MNFFSEVMRTLTVNTSHLMMMTPHPHLSLNRTNRKRCFFRLVTSNAQKIMDIKRSELSTAWLKTRSPPARFQKHSRDVIEEHCVIAHSLKDLHQSNALVRYSFELTDNTPIAKGNKSLPPRHNETVHAELNMMQEAGIETPAVFSWCFPVVSASKNDISPRVL